MKKRLLTFTVAFCFLVIAFLLVVPHMFRQPALMAEIYIYSFDNPYSKAFVARLYDNRIIECSFGQRDGAADEGVTFEDVEKFSELRLSITEYKKTIESILYVRDETNTTGLMVYPGVRSVIIKGDGFVLERTYNIWANFFMQNTHLLNAELSREDTNMALENDSIIRSFVEYIVNMSGMNIDLMNQDGLQLE